MLYVMKHNKLLRVILEAELKIKGGYEDRDWTILHTLKLQGARSTGYNKSGRE